MATTKLTFNNTTYEFKFDKAIDVNDEFRERYKILINGKDTKKFLIVSTQKINGHTDASPLRQKYQILVPSNTIRYGQRIGYHTPFTQYYDAGLPFEIVVSIIKELNKKY